jgi:hypothetical protein
MSSRAPVITDCPVVEARAPMRATSWPIWAPRRNLGAGDRREACWRAGIQALTGRAEQRHTGDRPGGRPAQGGIDVSVQAILMAIVMGLRHRHSGAPGRQGCRPAAHRKAASDHQSRRGFVGPSASVQMSCLFSSRFAHEEHEFRVSLADQRGCVRNLIRPNFRPNVTRRPRRSPKTAGNIPRRFRYIEIT